MGALIGQLLTAVGGEAFKALWTKVTDWWDKEGKVLFVGWYMKREGKQEQHAADRSVQLEREAREVSRAQTRLTEIDEVAAKRKASGDPPLWKIRPKR